MVDLEKQLKDLADGVYYLAQAVEKLALHAGDAQARALAQRGKREAHYIR